MQSVPNKINHIIRLFNTNIDGNLPTVHALCGIKGIGLRYSNILHKRSNVSTTKRAGELTDDEIQRLTDKINNPEDIPTYYLNRQRDFNDGSNSHLVGVALDASYRLFLERGKKMRSVKAERIMRGLKVRGQRTKSNGRHGGAMGVSKKK
ncbi:ribosomal protein S18 [Conglomerata obtusa]